MATTRELEKLSIDELTDEIVRLSKERDALLHEQERVATVRDRKLSEQTGRERLEAAGFGAAQIDAIAKAGLLTAGGEAQEVN